MAGSSPPHTPAEPPAVLSPGAFYGRVRHQWATELVTLSLVVHARPRKVPVHSHARAFLTLLVRGDYEEHDARRTIVHAPMSVIFHPEGMTHSDEIGACGAEFFVAEMAPEMLADTAARRGVRSIRDLSGGPAVWLMLELLHETLAGRVVPVGVDEPIAEVVDALAPERSAVGRHEPRWVARVEDLLRERFREAVALAEVAREAGVHPVHLSRVYRHFRGRPIRTTVHQLRIREACQLLQSSGLSLSQVALRTGFVDQSHLTHVCRRVTGYTPGAIRKLLAAAGRSLGLVGSEP